MKEQPKVAIGLVAWNGAKYLPACLESIQSQTYSNTELLVIDNGSTDNSVKLLEDNHPEVKLIKNPANLGFAGGHNQAIRNTSGDYYLALNQDVLMEPEYIAELVKSCEKNPHIGSAQGKIKQLTFERKTNMIDSLGLKLRRSGQAVNIAENEYDHGKNEEQEYIFGVAGTVPLYRRQALEDVSLKGPFAISGKEYFDETFFAYKEDVDLAFRLQLRNWRSIYVPTAVAYHERTVASQGSSEEGDMAIVKNRQNKSKFARKVSFRNHHYLQQKNMLWGNFLHNAPEMMWYEIKMWGYGIAREPFLLPDMAKVFSKWPEMSRKRKQIMSRRKAEAADIQKWFED